VCAAQVGTQKKKKKKDDTFLLTTNWRVMNEQVAAHASTTQR